MGAFENAMARLAQLPDDALGREWRWRDRDLDVRYALFRCLEEEQDALTRAREGWEPAEPERILSLAQRAFGDLRGLLVGLDAEVLDRPPAPGEWTIRETFRHVLEVEKRYATNTIWAAHRREGEPLRAPDERMPKVALSDVSGGGARLAERLAAARAQSDALLGALPESTLARPSAWGQVEVDVRFRLHRFASHLIEHTIQCEKVLVTLGVAETEARQIVRHISAVRAELEPIADEDVLHRLDAAHAERAGAATAASAAAASP